VPVDGDRLVGRVRDRLAVGKTIGIALSGGGDSTALLHLALAAGFRVEAITVDHRLRLESAVEAAAIAKACAILGVPHAVRVWEHGQVAGNLMDAARRARKDLVLDWAHERGIHHVALGHTRDDQAETLLMGLARRAGIAGLSGMRWKWSESGVTLHRPLLDTGREELRDWLRSQGIGWVDDPTNEDARFTRIKARKALATLRPLGITAEGLAEVAGHLASAQEALDTQVRAAAGRHVTVAAGALRVGSGLWAEPDEVQRQLVAGAVRWLKREAYLPRADDLRRFLHAIREGRDATLAGCRHRNAWIFREARALGPGVEPGMLWDRRWRVDGPAGTVRALGDAGLRAGPDWRATGLPREVLAVTPGVWHGEQLVSAPLAGWPNGWTAEVVASDHLFRLSD
jgi:tRNA(Ile)-lysidine synthase